MQSTNKTFSPIKRAIKRVSRRFPGSHFVTLRCRLCGHTDHMFVNNPLVAPPCPYCQSPRISSHKA